MTSPTQLSLRRLRKDGWLADVVERFLKHAGPHGVHKDLFGFADILAIHTDPPATIAVQACCRGDVSKRARKLLALDTVLVCLKAGWQVSVYGWSKPGRLWECRERKLILVKSVFGEIVT